MKATPKEISPSQTYTLVIEFNNIPFNPTSDICGVFCMPNFNRIFADALKTIATTRMKKSIRFKISSSSKATP